MMTDQSRRELSGALNHRKPQMPQEPGEQPKDDKEQREQQQRWDENHRREIERLTDKYCDRGPS